MGKKIPFHYNGKKYYWDVASREVTNEQGLLVAKDVPNLEAARIRLRHR